MQLPDLNAIPRTLLIVDDDEINRGLLAAIFSDLYTIREAAGGAEALQIIEAAEGALCAVLLDVMMPDIDGIELLRRLQPRGVPQRLPVFLITAEASDAVMREGYDLGVMDVISKPVMPYIVRRRVQSVVELFDARKRLSRTVERQQDELLRRAQQILELNLGMIETLSTAIEFRDGESGEHVRRIHDITALLFSRTDLGAGLSSEEVEWIALASIMHDVGKIAIPDAILNKPGKLTPEEFEIMKTHTLRGAELLESIPQLRASGAYRYAYDIARHHHERWDGRGYPDGLKGATRSAPGRRSSPWADVYDALSCKRVYKDAFDRDTVLRMICTGQCGAFAPRLLEVSSRWNRSCTACTKPAKHRDFQGGRPMDEKRKARLQAGGIDVDSALARMMGSEALLERFLGKFPDDLNYPALCGAIAAQDAEGRAAGRAHAQGRVRHLSITELFNQLTAQVAEFRAGDWDAAAARMPAIAAAYDRAVAAIRGEA